MGVVVVRVTRKFEKAYRRLPVGIKERAKEKERVFRDNPFDLRLETHKLRGEERDMWAFSIAHNYRIKFVFLSGSSVLFVDIGTHAIYK